jgi:hypothetical protein
MTNTGVMPGSVPVLYVHLRYRANVTPRIFENIFTRVSAGRRLGAHPALHAFAGRFSCGGRKIRYVRAVIGWSRAIPKVGPTPNLWGGADVHLERRRKSTKATGHLTAIFCGNDVNFLIL